MHTLTQLAFWEDCLVDEHGGGVPQRRAQPLFEQVELLGLRIEQIDGVLVTVAQTPDDGEGVAVLNTAQLLQGVGQVGT